MSGTIILTMRASEGNYTIPGSTVQKCMKCGEDVHCSPATINAALDLKEPPIEFICSHCFNPALVGKIEEFTDEQKKEVNDNL